MTGHARPRTPAVFQGKTALVTGGGTGLGLQISIRLGQLGAQVVCASRNKEHHRELLARAEQEGFRVLSTALDVRDPKEVRRVVRGAAEQFGGLDVVVNNAAGNFVRPALLLPPKAFANVVDIALNGVFYVSREAGLLMRQTGGSIVNISAPYATTGQACVIHSACAKAGVEALTRTLAAEWAPYGIRVNAVSPGPFVSEGAGERLWPSPEVEQAVLARIPLARFGDAREVAEMVAWLAGPECRWVTGSVFLADGGFSLPPSLFDATSKVRRRREGKAQS